MFPLRPLSLRTTEEVRRHLLSQWQRWLSFEFQRLRPKELWKRSVGSHFQNRVSLRHTLSSMWLSMHFVTIALRQLPICSGRCYLYKGTREPSYRIKSTDGSYRTYWWRAQGDHWYIFGWRRDQGELDFLYQITSHVDDAMTVMESPISIPKVCTYLKLPRET